MLTTDQTTPDAGALDARLTGSAYAPGEAGYDEHRQGFYLSADLRPSLVALPETAADIVEIVRFARDHGLRVAPQSTGHNAYPLEGAAGTVLLRTGRMRGVEIDLERRVARVEAGTWMIDVVEAAAPHGLMPLMGSSPDVGVVGFTLGAGVSWMARRYGLATNHVHAIEVVTADGRHVRADHVNEPDLFWALRGGGGNFGVVTAIEISLFAHAEVYGGVLFFPIERSTEVLQAWTEWTRTVPDDVTSIGRILRVPPLEDIPEPFRGREFVSVEAVYTGGEADGAELLAPLRALGPEMDLFGMLPGPAVNRLHMDPEGSVPGAISDHLLVDRLDGAGVAALVDATGPGSGSALMLVELRHMGGAMHRSAPHHGAADTMPGEFMAFAGGMPMGPEHAGAIVSSLEAMRAALGRYDTGRTYLNFVEHVTDPAAFYGDEAYARLRAIRAQVDPDGLFRANHQIPAAD